MQQSSVMSGSDVDIGVLVDDWTRQKCPSSAHHGERLLLIPKRNNRA